MYSFKGDTPSRWVEVSNGRGAGLTLALPRPFFTLKAAYRRVTRASLAEPFPVETYDIYRVNSTPFRPAPIAPASARIGTKKHRGLGMTVENRDQRIVIYLTESEYQALTWAADRARRRSSEAIRLVAIDWANSQVERAHQDRGPG